MSLQNNIVDLYFKAATSSRKVRTLLTPLGAFVFLTFLGLLVLLSLYTDKLLGLPAFVPDMWNAVIGLPILAAGLFLAFWSVLYFLRVKGTPVPFNPPPELVSTGPYAYTRNPMLIGVFVVLFGIGILLKSVSLTFLYTSLFIFLNWLELKAIEEPELEKRLGKEYLEYKRRTPMFIPWKRVQTG